MDPQIDEVWAYRARGIDPLVPVRLVKVGQNKPARVLVRFEDPDMEGREEWVPPARLKVPWDDVDAFVAIEARWKAIRDLGPLGEPAEAKAAEAIFDELVDYKIADLDFRDFYMTVRDLPALAQLAGVSEAELRVHPSAFVDDGGEVIVPWPVVLPTAQALARRGPTQVLAAVDNEERQFQQDLIHGPTWARGRAYRDHDAEVASIREFDERGYRQSRQLRREWCGSQATDRWDELVELRKEIHRVGQVAEEAITALRQHGHVADADRLARELGETVDMLRVDDAD